VYVRCSILESLYELLVGSKDSKHENVYSLATRYDTDEWQTSIKT